MNRNEDGPEKSNANTESPIGVFDSGVGGLTVLRALRERLPHESFIYLGDTARLPYGTKSRESIERYADQAAGVLLKRNIKCLVIACNTASAVALSTLQARLNPLPVIGVIDPGAAAGCAASKSGRIAVIATEGTVRGKAYEQAIARYRKDAHVTSVACSLFVALAEEGLTDGAIVEAIAHRYLDAHFAASVENRPDTLVLGCTHFPVLSKSIANVVGNDVKIVDSAVTTANALAETLARLKLAAREIPGKSSRLTLLASDGPERFARVGQIFLGKTLEARDVELVDIALASP